MIRNANIPTRLRVCCPLVYACGLRRLAAVLLLWTLFSSLSFAAGPYLVTNPSQVKEYTSESELAGLNANTLNPEDGNQSEATLPKDESFIVTLDKAITITKSEGLVVVFGRLNNEGSPKATKVEGRLNGGAWETIGYSYMQFRGGQGTIEYSKPIYADNKEYDELKFTVLKTALGYADGNKVRFNKFNIFMLKNGELYPDGRIDPWRLSTDYYKAYQDYKFQPTRGILDPRNHYGKNINYPTETPWGENNTFDYQGRTYELPTFKMQGDNQMPHVTEHTVYAMPGEIIPLVPYNELPSNPRYYVKFSHWYKYNVDKNGQPQAQDYAHITDASGERLFDFLVDPAGITFTNNAGYFGGNGLPLKSGALFVIRDADDIREFSELVSGGKKDLEAILAEDIDLKGASVYIEGPYAGTFNGNGHTISNLNIEDNGNGAVGFFKTLDAGASIRNLRLENCNVKNGGTAGILVGQINSVNNGSGNVSLSNIMVTGDLEITGQGNGGGLVGSVGYNITLDVSNAGYIGKIISSNESAALIGNADNNSIYCFLKNCYADAVVRKYKIDKWDGYYNACAAVNAKRDNRTFDNCVFNILTYTTFSDLPIYSYAEQSDVESNGAAYSYELSKYENTNKDQWGGPDYANPSPRKIYIAKDNWKDFVLILKKDNEASVILSGCDGSETIENIEYGYFILPDTWNYNGKYAIVPYIGSENLKTNFDWNMPGLFTVIQQEGSDEKDYHAFVYLDSNIKEFKEMVSGDTEISKWGKDEESDYPIPPMYQIDDSDLETSLETGEKYLSNSDATNGATKPQSWYGTSATFFKPLDTSKAPTDEANLLLGNDSFDIAADFSHEFEPYSSNNLDDDAKIIYSPIINFRHIFHVVSGKVFADENTCSAEANRNYLNGKRRVVSALAGKEFHVRLPNEFPVPFNQKVSNSTSYNDNIYSSTNFYYKSGENQYERARGFDIEVFKDGEPVTEKLFYFEKNLQGVEAPISLPGKRQYKEGGPSYYTAGGEGLVHRMLECENAQPGRYIVRIFALDDENNPVHVWDDPNSKLYMMEYDITFLEDDDASFVVEKSIPDTHKDSYLSQEEVCGDPVVFLNFDEYRAFNNSSNPEDYFMYDKDYANYFGDVEEDKQKSFKWPTIWSQCSYSFGYAGFRDYDYNEYTIANHASQVNWASSARGFNDNFPGSPSGLYDRLYYDTEGKEKGFFYYVNAASDPGVTSRLKIDRLCLGSTVVVTAWVSEFSPETEKANVAFNFSAVMKDGTRLRLHSFITGYVQSVPNWHHVYYSFVPELPETVKVSDVDHYELEVENNCKSSQGADYAVDDIRAYIVTPEITAKQLSPMCDGEATSTGVQLRTRFDKLLASQGIVELDDDDTTETGGGNGEEKEEDMCTVYVAMFDKARYDADLADETKTMTEALQNSLVRLEDEKGELQQWISFKMSKNFNNLTDFNPANPEEKYLEALGYKSEKGVKYLVANIKPDATKIQVGKRYLVSIRLVDGSVSNAQEMTLEDFSVSEDDCAKYGVLTLQGSGIVKVDGFAYTTDDEIEVCAGQAPVLQVELLKVGEDKKTVSTEKYYYDWFLGPMDGMSDDEFMQLTNFRDDYKDATEIPVADRRVPGPDFENLSDEEYATLVEKYAAIASLVKDGALFLHQSSFVFPEISSDPDFNKNLVVTAIPIIDDQKEDGEKVCGGASEIRLKVHDASPKMYDGFTAINYPGYMTDVPLRVGLRQLREVSTQVTEVVTGSLEAFRHLQVPLRAIRSYKGDESKAEMKVAKTNKKGDPVDPFVYIVETNDPAYKTLTKHPGDNLVDSSLELKPKEDDPGLIEGLLPVGIVTGLAAVKGQDDNAVEIVFSKDMQFREGYYYKMRFDFDETLDEATEATGYCPGQTVFTIKVVPEYQRWTGNAGRNWNNDGNWTRIAKKELFLTASDRNIGGDNGVLAADHTTDEDGNNTNTLSYAPMDFTKVIVPNDVNNFPLMFKRTQSEVMTLQDSQKWDEVDADGEATHHVATKDIKYDMASLSLPDVLACRPWYANTCDEIHFQSGAELMRQQYFKHSENYQKAWADLEVVPNRWYTLTAPLQQVVAGDMYTISEGAKQNTELFQDIKFNNDEYGRFEPAVYQRSWNKDSEAEVYSFGDNSNAYTDAAAGISLNWSRVYNQVDVNYSGGEGFSINTRFNADEDDNFVRFRLPKADTKYEYYTNDDKTEKQDDKQIGTRENRHKLNEFPMETPLSAREDSKYFLVGNPFIARMDMAKFFEGNRGLSKKYWIMSGDRQDAYLWKGHGDEFISTTDGDDNGECVATMQGFFVEANEETTNLTVKFSADMIKVTDGEGAAGPLKIGRSVGSDRLLNIVAEAGDAEISRAVIYISGDASGEYDAEEDVAMIVDRSQDIPTAVYTSASGRALAINSLDRIERTEVGVVALPEMSTLLRFEGVEDADGLKLLDTATGESFDLYDGMTFGVEGSSAGRLYIVRSNEEPEIAEVAVRLDRRTVSVTAPAEGITAQAFDASGVCLGEWTSEGAGLSFDVVAGVILVDVTAAGHHLTRKFIVK